MTNSIKKKINSRQALLDYCLEVTDFWEEHKYINATASVLRSNDQNALIHAAFQIIADHRNENHGDTNSLQVKRECKLTYGTHILRRDDPMYDWVYRQTLDKLVDYEKKLKCMDSFQVTSVMSPVQLKEFYKMICDDAPFVLERIEELKTRQKPGA